MVISNYPSYFPNAIFVLPDMQELKCTHYHLPVFHMRKCMLAGFNGAIIFYGVNFKAAGHQLAGKYKILLKHSAKGGYHIVIVLYTVIILKKFKVLAEKWLHGL